MQSTSLVYYFPCCARKTLWLLTCSISIYKEALSTKDYRKSQVVQKVCFYAKTLLYVLSIVYSYPLERKYILELIKNKTKSQLNSTGICPEKSNFESYHREADEIIPNWVCKQFQLTRSCVTLVTLKLHAIPLCC